MIRNGSPYVLATSWGGGDGGCQWPAVKRLTRRNGGDCSVQTTFLNLYRAPTRRGPRECPLLGGKADIEIWHRHVRL